MSEQKEYIITDDELNTLENMDQNDFVSDLLQRVRSRNVLESDKWTVERRAKAGIITFGEYSLAEHDAAIRKEERERALKVMTDYRDLLDYPNCCPGDTITILVDWIRNNDSFKSASDPCDRTSPECDKCKGGEE